MSLHKLLVPFNYSDCAYNGLNYAGRLAQKLSAKLVILHALNNDHIASDEEVTLETIKHTSRIKSYCDESPVIADLMIDISINSKAPEKAIKEAADLYDIDLIVMGTEGVEKPMKELVGTLTYHVIEKSKTPILSVPKSASFIPIQIIGFGVDYKRIEDTHALDVLKDFAYSFNGEIDIFHVQKYHEPQEFLEPHEEAKLDKYFKGLSHTFQSIESKSVKDGLSVYLEKASPQVVALVPRKYPFFEWLYHESVSEVAVQHFKIPVLTIPE